MGFPIGSLPMRYLGIPISAKRLHVSDYFSLIGKINKRISSWEARLLSYSGRVELINW